jgi:hypothetical protein
VLFATRKLPVGWADRPGDLHPHAEFFQQVDCALNLAAELGKEVRGNFFDVLVLMFLPEFTKFPLGNRRRALSCSYLVYPGSCQTA